MMRRGGAVVVLLVAMFGSVSCKSGPLAGGACKKGLAIPTPTVSSGSTKIAATSGVVNTCESDVGMIHLDGKLMGNGQPDVVRADGDVIITSVKGLKVEATWDAGAFTDKGDGTYTAPAPTTGCHRLNIVVRDPDSENRGNFAVQIAATAADCAPPPKTAPPAFSMDSITPNTAEIRAGETKEVAVVVKAINPPTGFFCPQGTVVSGVALTTVDFTQGCTTGATAEATLEISGNEPGVAVIEVRALLEDGTRGAGSVTFTVTVTP